MDPPPLEPEGPYKIGSVHPSILLSALLGCFLGTVSLVFLDFGMMLETHIKLCMTEPEFAEKKCFAPKIGKMVQKWAQNRVFWIYWKLLSLVCTEFVLCSCTNPIFGKRFISEIWAKMVSANNITGFFNLLYLQNQSSE